MKPNRAHDPTAEDEPRVGPLEERLARLRWPEPEPGLKERMLREFEEQVGLDGEDSPAA